MRVWREMSLEAQVGIGRFLRVRDWKRLRASTLIVRLFHPPGDTAVSESLSHLAEAGCPDVW